MFEDEFDERKSMRGSTRRRPLLLLGGLLALVIASLPAWYLLTRQSPPTTSNATATPSSNSAVSDKTGQPDPPIYWQTIEGQIAQGLHLTVAQVKARLQPPPGQRDSLGIAHVASEQGISEAQLRVIEINAIQKGHDLLVRMGILTQQGSDLGMQRIRSWDQATLDDHVTGWFLNN